MLALQRGFAASKPGSCVITYLLQLKVLKHGLSLMKNVPGIQGVHLVPGDKILGGADTGPRHNSRPCSSTAPAGIAGVSRKSCCICWSQQHKTSCAFIRELNFIPLVRLCKCWPNGSLVTASHYSSPWAFGKEQDRGVACQEKQVLCIFLCPPSLCRSQSGL